jgi:hypothetical protein
MKICFGRNGYLNVDAVGPFEVDPLSPVTTAGERYPAELKCAVFFEELVIARIYRNSSAFYGTRRLTYAYA